MEGIAAKQKTGMYTPKETSWVKIRNPYYSQAEGRQELFEKRLGARLRDRSKSDRASGGLIRCGRCLSCFQAAISMRGVSGLARADFALFARFCSASGATAQ